MLEMPNGPTPGDDQTSDSIQAAEPRAEAPTVNCPYCETPIPDNQVATGLCHECWNALPSELESCYARRP